MLTQSLTQLMHTQSLTQLFIDQNNTHTLTHDARYTWGPEFGHVMTTNHLEYKRVKVPAKHQEALKTKVMGGVWATVDISEGTYLTRFLCHFKTKDDKMAASDLELKCAESNPMFMGFLVNSHSSPVNCAVKVGHTTPTFELWSTRRIRKGEQLLRRGNERLDLFAALLGAEEEIEETASEEEETTSEEEETATATMDEKTATATMDEETATMDEEADESSPDASTDDAMSCEVCGRQGGVFHFNTDETATNRKCELCDPQKDRTFRRITRFHAL